MFVSSTKINWGLKNILYLKKTLLGLKKSAFKSNKILFDVGNKHGLSRSHIQIGDFYFLMGNYNEALKNYNEALRINSENKRFAMNIYSRLGELCFYNENYEL